MLRPCGNRGSFRKQAQELDPRAVEASPGWKQGSLGGGPAACRASVFGHQRGNGRKLSFLTNNNPCLRMLSGREGPAVCHALFLLLSREGWLLPGGPQGRPCPPPPPTWRFPGASGREQEPEPEAGCGRELRASVEGFNSRGN